MFCALRSFQLAVVVLGLTSGLAAAEPNWIWSADNALDKEPLGTRYFRRELKLGANPITRAEVEITADDEYELFINGQSIGHGNKWQQLDRYDIKPLLTDGPNVIAVAATNRGGQAGLVAHVKVEMQNLPAVELATDKQWLTSSSEAYGWNRVKFDAAAWKPAHVYGPLGTTAPWGKVDVAGQVVSAPLPKVRKVHTGPAEKFELRDGDRVVFLGNTLIEREQKYGYLETALTERYPNRNVTFRNLGWSGDTVWGEARAVFGTQADGFRALKEHVLALKPTVIMVGYGTNESFAGVAGLPHFLDGLNALIDALDETDARIVLLSPLRMDELGPPLPDPQQQNTNLELYSKAIEQVGGERGCVFVDLFNTIGLRRTIGLNRTIPAGTNRHSTIHLTEDEVHLTQVGYSYLAAATEYLMLGPNQDRAWYAEVDATTRKLKSGGMHVTDPMIGRNEIRFTATDDMLPYPSTVPELARETLNGLCTSNDHFQVEGLPTGHYQLTIDGKPVLSDSAEEFAKSFFLRKGPSFDQAEELRRAIIHKNELYFNRWRPANVTYLFLFRRNEQGQNAVEIPKFDPLIAEAEQQIARLRVPKPHVFELKPVEENSK